MLEKNKCIVKIKWLNEVFKKMNGFGKVKKNDTMRCLKKIDKIGEQKREHP